MSKILSKTMVTHGSSVTIQSLVGRRAAGGDQVRRRLGGAEHPRLCRSL